MPSINHNNETLYCDVNDNPADYNNIFNSS